MEYGKYNRESTNTDFASDLIVEGVILEIWSLNTLLMIFKNSSIVNLTTEALKPFLLQLNRDQSRRLYFRDYICRLRSRFKALRSDFRGFVIKYIIEDLSKFFNSGLNVFPFSPYGKHKVHLGNTL